MIVAKNLSKNYGLKPAIQDISTINYPVGRQDLLTIQKVQRPAQNLMLTRGQGQVLFWVPVVFIPLLVLATGIVVWNRRRAR